MEDYGEEANAAHGEDYGHEETNSSADQDQEQRDEEVEGGGEREHEEEDAGRAAFLSQPEEVFQHFFCLWPKKEKISYNVFAMFA